jgi:hypothetical protein
MGSKPAGEGDSVEGLRCRLSEILRETPSTAAELIFVVDEALPVLRKLLESRVSFSLSSFTTSEILDLFRKGTGATVDSSLVRALRTADSVRFRSMAPTLEEILAFKNDLRSWLETDQGAAAFPGGRDV